MVLPPLRPDATLHLKSAPGCDPKSSRKMYSAWNTQIPGSWVPGVHAACTHNEIAALSLRSLCLNPVPADLSCRPVLDVFAGIRGVARKYGGTRWTYLETAESYTGSLRRRYLEAERSLRDDGPLTRNDWYIGAFLKAEKFNPALKVAKPRMIFPRSPRYNLVLASWLKPFEHWLWGCMTGAKVFGGSSTRVVAKGLNQRQRGGLIAKKFKSLEDCVVFEVDGKAFEAHVEEWQLRDGEHPVYYAAFGKHGLADVLSHQLKLSGVTQGGVKFSRVGGRASGDFNTGMGNSLIMLAVVVAVLKTYGVPFDLLVDGDNALVFLRGRDATRVRCDFAALAHRFSGHEMVLEKPVCVMEEIRFGQCAPVWFGGGWCMVRDYRKVVSGACSSHVHLKDPSFVGRYLRGVALCEASLSRGLPVLQAWSSRLFARTKSLRAVDASFYRDYQVLGVDVDQLVEPVAEEVQAETRVSFERAFGLSPEAQLQLENSFVVPTRWVGWTYDEWPSGGSWFDARPGLVESFFE